MKQHWKKLFGIVDDTWEYNGTSLRLCPASLRSCRRRRVDVIIRRLGGMVQGNGVLEVNGSLSRLRSPLRLGPRQAGLPFLSFLSRVSLSPDPSPLDCAIPASLSLSFSRSHAGKTSVVSPLADQYLMILLHVQRSRIIIYGSVVSSKGWNVISELEISR